MPKNIYKGTVLVQLIVKNVSGVFGTQRSCFDFSECVVNLDTVSITAIISMPNKWFEHSKSCPAPHSRKLSPGEFNDTILEPLHVYPESFMTITVIP